MARHITMSCIIQNRLSVGARRTGLFPCCVLPGNAPKGIAFCQVAAFRRIKHAID